MTLVKKSVKQTSQPKKETIDILLDLIGDDTQIHAGISLRGIIDPQIVVLVIVVDLILFVIDKLIAVHLEPEYLHRPSATGLALEFGGLVEPYHSIARPLDELRVVDVVFRVDFRLLLFVFVLFTSLFGFFVDVLFVFVVFFLAPVGYSATCRVAAVVATQHHVVAVCVDSVLVFVVVVVFVYAVMVAMMVLVMAVVVVKSVMTSFFSVFT